MCPLFITARGLSENALVFSCFEVFPFYMAISIMNRLHNCYGNLPRNDLIKRAKIHKNM